MRPKTLTLILSTAVVGMLLAVALLPVGIAGALPQASPTAGGLSDFVIPTSTPSGGTGFDIPTSTPSGGFAIPTSTPSSGFVIPTSTPGGAAPAGPGFPLLTDEQLLAINLQPGDVPADFAPNQETATFMMADTVASLQEQGSTDIAGMIQQSMTIYGWNKYIAVRYASCQQSVPITSIYSDVAQLTDADMGRRMINDPIVQFVFTDNPVLATTVHGWFVSYSPSAGDCFAQEVDYYLFFEYWGLFMSVSMTADANTDPALVTGLLEQLAAAMIAHADAQSPSPLPPTPAPDQEQPPTEAPMGPTPTQALLQPSPTTAAVLPPTWTPEGVAGGATLQDVDQVMPTSEEFGMTGEGYALNQELSGIYTAEQLVALWQQAGLTEIATALQHNAQQNGMIGQVSRVWDTGGGCPEVGALSLEVDVTLFQTAQGAQAYLNDPGYSQALRNAGITLEPSPDGGLIASVVSSNQCGEVITYSKNVLHGRFMVSSQIIVYTTAGRDEALGILDLPNQFTIQKLDGAGLQ